MDKRGICVEWDNPERSVIRWDFYDWTWDDFHAASQHTLKLFETDKGGARTPSILNLKHSKRIPPGVFPHSRFALDLMDESDYTVIAEASGLARTLTEIFLRFNRQAREKVFIVNTLDDARTFITARTYQQGSE